LNQLILTVRLFFFLLLEDLFLFFVGGPFTEISDIHLTETAGALAYLIVTDKGANKLYSYVLNPSGLDLCTTEQSLSLNAPSWIRSISGSPPTIYVGYKSGSSLAVRSYQASDLTTISAEVTLTNATRAQFGNPTIDQTSSELIMPIFNYDNKSDELEIFDSTLATETEVASCRSPQTIAIDYEGASRLRYIFCPANKKIQIRNTSNTLLATLTTGEYPKQMLVGSDGTTRYVSILQTNGQVVLHQFAVSSTTYIPTTTTLTLGGIGTSMGQYIGAGVVSDQLVVAVPEDNSISIIDLSAQSISSTLTFPQSIDSIDPATVEVLNDSGKYDPRNTSSPLYGSVVPRKRIWARSVYGNVLYPGFFGTITTVEPRPLDGKVDLIAESVMADLARGRFASSFIENVSYYTVRGRVLAAVRNRDPWLENSTTGASRRARYLHGPEGNNFYTGTDGVVGALDVLDDLNEATGSQHYIQPSVHAMILWKYTSKARTQITDTNSDFTIDEDFVGLSGVRLTHEALENYQQVPWQAFEMGPVPEDDTNGNGSGTVAQAVALGVGYGDVQVDLDPYLHYTREAYGDNGDVPEPTYKVTKRRRRIDRNGDRKRDRGRRFVKKRQRIYHDPFVPFTIAEGEVRRIAFDFALPVSGPVMSIQGPAGVTAITAYLDNSMHIAIKKIGEDIDGFKFNTAISQMMSLLNLMEQKEQTVTTDIYADFLKVLSPFAPHITEELWHDVLGKETSILTEKFPEPDPSKLEFDDVTIAIQINGKLRGEFTISKDATKEDLEINAREVMTSRLVGKTITRVIVVPKKLVNFVVAE
jgi:hypothetical protein